jgi:hypothetical protein
MSSVSLLQRLLRKVDKTLAAPFFIDQWLILTAPRLAYRNLDWRAFRPLIPPKDRYWGDPFVIERGDGYYVFIEEKPYASGRGHIACLTLDVQGNLASQQVVLERPYHLSYPFLFEQAGELFMIPESAAHRTVELYRCAHFPDRWEFVRELMTDIYAVDATLLQHADQYWLFANVKAPGGSSLDALHLYHSSMFDGGNWTPHPWNPVVHDIRSARPAGRIFQQDGQWIRPSQDSGPRYGYGLKFNRITRLTDTDYAEVTEASFSPSGSRYLATHTFNQAGQLTVVDAVLRRRK